MQKECLFRMLVDYCIGKGVLADFLSKNRAEAIAVSIFEFDEEKFLKSEREESKKEGQKEGEEKLAGLLRGLMDAGKMEEMKRALSDREYREKLYQEK